MEAPVGGDVHVPRFILQYHHYCKWVKQEKKEKKWHSTQALDSPGNYAEAVANPDYIRIPLYPPFPKRR